MSPTKPSKIPSLLEKAHRGHTSKGTRRYQMGRPSPQWLHGVLLESGEYMQAGGLELILSLCPTLVYPNPVFILSTD
jgi:hypothetical protein